MVQKENMIIFTWYKKKTWLFSYGNWIPMPVTLRLNKTLPIIFVSGHTRTYPIFHYLYTQICEWQPYRDSSVVRVKQTQGVPPKRTW